MHHREEGWQNAVQVSPSRGFPNALNAASQAMDALCAVGRQHGDDKKKQQNEQLVSLVQQRGLVDYFGGETLSPMFDKTHNTRRAVYKKINIQFKEMHIAFISKETSPKRSIQ